jgi:hypothetical protein
MVHCHCFDITYTIVLTLQKITIVLILHTHVFYDFVVDGEDEDNDHDDNADVISSVESIRTATAIRNYGSAWTTIAWACAYCRQRHFML